MTAPPGPAAGGDARPRGTGYDRPMPRRAAIVGEEVENGAAGPPGIAVTIDPRKMGRYRMEAWALRAAMAVFRAVGLDAASALGGLVGRLVGPRTGWAKTAERNIRRAFPEMGDREAAAALTAMWDNLGRALAEFPHAEALRLDRPGRRIALVGKENVDRACGAGRPILFVSGHFANWELMAPVLVQCGLDLASVYRAPNNPFVHDWLARRRSRMAAPVQIPKGRAGARAIAAVAARGGHLAVLADQKLDDGIAAPLLGREAMTTPLPARLALRGYVVLPVSLARLGGARFRMEVHPPLPIERTGDRAADIAAATRRLNDVLGAWIRARPGEWLWIHRRWPD